MSEQLIAPRSLSRRRFMVLTGIAIGAGGLLAACQAAAPAASPAAPPTAVGAAANKAAPVTTGASALKCTKLTIIGGNSYVPAQDGELDALVKQLSADTGMDAKIERFADAQMDAKVAAVIEAAYASLAVSDPAKKYVYGESGWPAGGRIRPHRTHQNGTAVDFMVPVVDATGRSVPFPPAYSTSSVMASSSIRMLGTRLWPSTSRRSPTIFMPFTKPRSSTASASPG